MFSTNGRHVLLNTLRAWHMAVQYCTVFMCSCCLFATAQRYMYAYVHHKILPGHVIDYGCMEMYLYIIGILRMHGCAYTWASSQPAFASSYQGSLAS